MKFNKTNIEDLYLINNKGHDDERGSFIKTFHHTTFKNIFKIDLKERYYTISKKNTIRGLHFQNRPYEHSKLIYCINGSILDVVIDLRKKSKTFLNIFSHQLTSRSLQSILIPHGCAHGFLSLEDNSILIYNVDSEYNKENDSGIFYKSIDFNWGINNPIISNRDKEFVKLQDFKNFF